MLGGSIGSLFGPWWGALGAVAGGAAGGASDRGFSFAKFESEVANWGFGGILAKLIDFNWGGRLLDSLFGFQDPRAKLGGREAAAGTNPYGSFETVLGEVFGISSKDFGHFWEADKAGGQVAQAIKQLDQIVFDVVSAFGTDSNMEDIIAALDAWVGEWKNAELTVENILESRFAAVMSNFTADVQEFVAAGLDLDDQVKRLSVALAATKLVEENPDQVLTNTLQQVLAVVNALVEGGQDVGEAFETLATNMSIAQAATESLAEYAGTDLATSFDEFMEIQARTTQEWLGLSAANVRKYLDEFDGTTTGLVNIMAATQERYELELRYLQQIAALAATIEARLLGLRDQIDEAINPKSADQLRSELEDQYALLGRATSPEEVDRITASIDKLARQLWAVTPEEEREAVGQWLIGFLEDSNTKAQAMLDTMRQAAIEESNALRADIDYFLENLGTPLELAAADLGVAAALLIEAAGGGGDDGVTLPPGWTIDPDTGLPVPPGGYAVQPGDGKDSGDVVAALETTNSAMVYGADTLAREGAAFRTAANNQAAAASALAAAVRSLPGRIVVQVEAPLNEFA
jgi:hypothetical protein